MSDSSPRRRRLLWRVGRVLAFLFVIVLVFMFWQNLQPQTPAGLVAGQLPDCPAGSQNCVSSTAGEPDCRVEALYSGPLLDEAWAAVIALVQDDGAARIVEQQKDYVHAEYVSKWLRFVDDVELHLNRESNRIDVRSASRVGRSDLGVNRKRVENLQSALSARLSEMTSADAGG